MKNFGAVLLGVVGLAFVVFLFTPMSTLIDPAGEVAVEGDRVTVDLRTGFSDERRRGHQHFWVWERSWEPVTGWDVYLDEVYADHLLERAAQARIVEDIGKALETVDVVEELTVDVPPSVSDVPEINDVE